MSKELPLKVLNLCAKGMSITDAYAIYNKGKESSEGDKKSSEPKKLTLDERKAELADKITAAGGDVPAKTASIAKYNEALTAAESTDEEEDSLY